MRGPYKGDKTYTGFKPWGKPGWPGHPDYKEQPALEHNDEGEIPEEEEKEDAKGEVPPREDDSGGGEVPE